jgi:hypothetical protein
MFSLFRNRFGIPGVISIVALVFAMLGGAYAATKQGGLNAKQKKQVRSIAKKQVRSIAKSFQGTGPAGPAGPQGPAGAKGADGQNGSNGASGANGKSVTVTDIPPEEPACEELGGALVKQEGAVSGTEVCNGQTGFTSTLPPGKTETGAWAVSSIATVDKTVSNEYSKAWTSISFTIPLPEGLDENHVHYSTDAGFAIDCPGTAGEPTANPGHLCIYKSAGALEKTFIVKPDFSNLGATATGALIEFENKQDIANGTAQFALGSWAVTAP